MTKVRWIAPAVLVTSLVAAGITVPVALGGNEPDPTFKTLHRPATAQDHLPAEPGVPGGPLGAIDPDSARLVGNVDGHDVYMAPGPDDTVCLIDRDEQGSFGAGCMRMNTIKHGPTYTAWRDGDSGEVTIAIPVPDAYDSVKVDGRALPVRNNVALGHVPTGRATIELSGDARLEGDITLGDSTPPAGG